MVKSAVLKPMPIARDATATAVNPGLLRNQRSAYRISETRDSSKTMIIIREALTARKGLTMITRFRRVCTLVVVAVICATSFGTRTSAQNGALFSLEQVLDFPFPANLVAAPNGSAIAWTFAERGARNIYVAQGPDFKASRVTPYLEDDGQELTNVSFARDGR